MGIYGVKSSWADSAGIRPQNHNNIILNHKGIIMKANRLSVLFIAAISFFLLSGFLGIGDDQTPEEARAEIITMRSTTLNDLYQLAPQSKKEIQAAAGYAVFSNFGMNIFLISTANGAGIAHNNKTGKDIYMNMFSGGAGIGLGIKKFRGVFVFDNQQTFNDFVNTGWQAGAQADAAAQHDDEGAALAASLDVAPGVKLYQITDDGLALQATIQGTKYWKDEELNK